MKTKSFRKTTLCFLLTVSLSSLLLVGCGNKTNTTNDSSQASTTSGNKNPNGRKFDPTEMKKRTEDAIAALVKDGTLTQEQGDKITTALTTNMGTSNQKDKNNNTNNNSQNSSNNTITTNNNNNNGTRKRGTNPALAKLVTDGVLTQAQADAITKKLQEGYSSTKNN